MRYLGSLLIIFWLCFTTVAQNDSKNTPPKPATLMSGISNLHHPVTATNPDAQEFFDQGLRLIYAFNHDEAARSFRRATDLDPRMAMAYWGIAEAVGPNYNDPASEERFQQAHVAIEKAVSLSSLASATERDYIQAMAKRFPAAGADRRKAAEDYHDAMRELMNKYPDDLDAATLFAESGMNLHPWGLWMHDGTPREGTEEIVSTLESVIKRDPNHLGAVHYYIHAVEASPSPERALAAANRLAALAPAAGHLVHMPAHVYIRTGDYDAAVKTNEKAAAADEAYIKTSAANGIQPGMYSGMYYSHNLHFIAIAASMKGNYLEAKQAADKLAIHVLPMLKGMPMLEGFVAIPIAVQVRFEKWNEILRMPQPDPNLKTVTTFWHYGRGMALAGTGKLDEAEKEHAIIVATREATPVDAIFSPPWNNKTKDILQIADDVLAAKIAMTRKDTDTAIARYQNAVRVQDTLNYGEPPDWYFPVRESLGGALLIAGKATDAEKVFREDLNRNARNPRSLFGLHQALKVQGRDHDAQFVEKQFRDCWDGVGLMLKVESLV
jgi:tetratricopeptide (TPR) repeat protein